MSKFRSTKVIILEEAVELSTLIFAAENTPIVYCDISPHSQRNLPKCVIIKQPTYQINQFHNPRNPLAHVIL
jgi:hypothetical protein